MNKRWALVVMGITFVAATTISCLPSTLDGGHRDTKVPAKYPLRPKEGPKHNNKEEIKILVLCSMSQIGTSDKYTGMDRELCTILSEKLTDAAKENNDKVAIIPSSNIETFKTTNPSWKSMRPATIGRRLGADVVLDVSLGNINIDQPSNDNKFYQWRVNAHVSVYDSTEDNTRARCEYVHNLRYPRAEINPDVSEEIGQYRQQFLDRLARDLVKKHFDFLASNGIATDY